MSKTKKLSKLEKWVRILHLTSVENHDFTKEMALREVIRKIEEIKRGDRK